MIKYLMPIVPFFMTIAPLCAQDVAKGQQLYQTCIQCHGERGEGKQEMLAPRIGGQHAWYIVTSINMFRSGERKNPTMLPFIKNLSETDIGDVAAYVATLKSAEEVAPAEAATEGN